MLSNSTVPMNALDQIKSDNRQRCSQGPVQWLDMYFIHKANRHLTLLTICFLHSIYKFITSYHIIHVLFIYYEPVISHWWITAKGNRLPSLNLDMPFTLSVSLSPFPLTHSLAHSLTHTTTDAPLLDGMYRMSKYAWNSLNDIKMERKALVGLKQKLEEQGFNWHWHRDTRAFPPNLFLCPCGVWYLKLIACVES